MTRKMILLTAALLLVAAPIAAQHRMHRNMTAEAPESGERCMMPALDLTAEQESAMEKLRLEHRKEMIDLRASVRKARLDMQEALMSDDLDAGALKKTADKLTDARGKIEAARVDHLLSVRKVLDDEQWKVFVRHHAGGEGMHGRGGRGMHRDGRRGCGMHDGGKRGMRGGGDGRC
mgnify:CR=1 FL=1